MSIAQSVGAVTCPNEFMKALAQLVSWALFTERVQAETTDLGASKYWSRIETGVVQNPCCSDGARHSKAFWCQ